MIWSELQSRVMDNIFTTQPSSVQPDPWCQYKIQASQVAIFFLRAISFMSFMVFILCLPLGDPKETCTNEVCNKEEMGQPLAYNYICTVYRALETTVKVTSNTMQEVSEYTSCFIVDALHEAKLKFYTLLRLVDKQDLCRTVCCQNDDLDLELSPRSSSSSPSSSKGSKKNCRCKTKCCKRQQQQPRDSRESLY